MDAAALTDDPPEPSLGAGWTAVVDDHLASGQETVVDPTGPAVATDLATLQTDLATFKATGDSLGFGI